MQNVSGEQEGASGSYYRLCVPQYDGLFISRICRIFCRVEKPRFACFREASQGL